MLSYKNLVLFFSLSTFTNINIVYYAMKYGLLKDREENDMEEKQKAIKACEKDIIYNKRKYIGAIFAGVILIILCIIGLAATSFNTSMLSIGLVFGLGMIAMGVVVINGLNRIDCKFEKYHSEFYDFDDDEY